MQATVAINDKGEPCGLADAVDAMPVAIAGERGSISFPAFQAEAGRAKTKREALAACLRLLGQMGAFSDCPRDVWDKLHAWAGLGGGHE